METKLKGFFNSLSEEQKKASLEYRGPDSIGTGIHSCPKCTSEPYHQGHNEAECAVCEGQFWLDENDLPFNPDREVRHGEVLRSMAQIHSD